MGANEVKTIVRLNTVILTNLRVQSINEVNIPDISSNKLRGDAIRFMAHREIGRASCEP